MFFLGLAAVLVPLGAGSSALASVVTLHREVADPAGRVGDHRVRRHSDPGRRVEPAPGGAGPAADGRPRHWVCTLGLGAAYGLAGFCSGPILGAVLTVAAARSQPLRGAALLAVYALGMAAPLFVLAALWQRFDLGRRRWLRGREYRIGGLRLHTTSTVSGLLFIAVGAVFLLFDGTAGLYSTGTGTSLAVQNAITAAGGHVPDSVLLGALAAVVLIVVALRLRRSSTNQRKRP